MRVTKDGIIKFFFSTAGVKNGPEILQLWQAGTPEANRGLISFFYPVISELSEFYAAQTKAPELAFDDFFTIGLQALERARLTYFLGHKHSFRTYAKIAINEAMFDACETYDANLVPSACAVPSYAPPPPALPIESRDEAMRGMFASCAKLAEITAEEARLLNRKLVEGAAARALGLEFDICGQQVLNRVAKLKDRISNSVPRALAEEIACSL